MGSNLHWLMLYYFVFFHLLIFIFRLPQRLGAGVETLLVHVDLTLDFTRLVGIKISTGLCVPFS